MPGSQDGPWELGSHVEGAKEDTIHLSLSHSLRRQSPRKGVQPPSSGDRSISSGHGGQEEGGSSRDEAAGVWIPQLRWRKVAPAGKSFIHLFSVCQGPAMCWEHSEAPFISQVLVRGR